jgi:hypothetical protein
MSWNRNVGREQHNPGSRKSNDLVVLMTMVTIGMIGYPVLGLIGDLIGGLIGPGWDDIIQGGGMFLLMFGGAGWLFWRAKRLKRASRDTSQENRGK